MGYYEQIALIVRYFDDEKWKPVGTFISIQRLTSVDALSIVNTLLVTSKISEVNIIWNSILAVCFDS